MSFASSLRHRITIQSAPSGSDDEGNPNTEWTEVRKLWADIRVAGGLESIRAGAVTSEVRASIRIRRTPGLNAGMRVVHGATTYNIIAVPPSELNNVSMDLVCEVVK